MYFHYGPETVYYVEPWLLLFIPAIIIGVIANASVQSTYAKYARTYNSCGWTGAMTAERLLMAAGIDYISITSVNGTLSDHFDPRRNVIRLSRGVYDSASVSAVAIAAHECGHAMQHEEGYGLLRFRNTLAPVTNVASKLVMPLILLGFILGITQLTTVAAVAFGIILVFQLVTLPVEFNASHRALAAIEAQGVLNGEELRQARKVLNAAALTYVAATLMALVQFLRFASLANRRK